MLRCCKLLESGAPAEVRCLMAPPTVEPLSKILLFFVLLQSNSTGKCVGARGENAIHKLPGDTTQQPAKSFQPKLLLECTMLKFWCSMSEFFHVEKWNRSTAECRLRSFDLAFKCPSSVFFFKLMPEQDFV